MRTFINKANTLSQQIEMGFYTQQDALYLINQLRSEVAAKYYPGSYEYIQIVEVLKDADYNARQF